MQVIGFNFEKIQAEKKNLMKSKVEITSNINIKSITQEKITLIKEQPALKFTFEFRVDYKPNIAEIILQGFILILFVKDEVKTILKKWKNKQISDDIRIPLFNIILTKSSLRALQLEGELNLPTHVPLPRIKQQQSSEKNNNRSYAG